MQTQGEHDTHQLIPLAALVFANLLVFYPAFFQNSALTPAGSLENLAPWRSVHHLPYVYNSELAQDAIRLQPIFALARRQPEAGLWDPHLGLGGIGFFRLSSGFWSPLVFLPALIVPFSIAPTTIAFLKLNVAFLFAFVFLLRRHLAPPSAAIGALIWALAPPMAWGWLAPATAVAAFFPALLLVIDRTSFEPLRRGTMLAGTLALAGFLAGGHLPTIGAGALVALAYLMVSTFDLRIVRLLRAVARLAGMAILALALLAPAIQLERAAPAAETAVPAEIPLASALQLTALPESLGHPADGVASLRLRDHATYPGVVALLLLPLGFASARRYRRPFFFAILALAALLASWTAQAGFFSAAVPQLAAINLMALFGCAVLAAYGADSLARRFWQQRHWIHCTLLAAALADMGYAAVRYWEYRPLEAARLAASEGMLTMARRRRLEPFRTLQIEGTFPAALGGRYGLEALDAELPAIGTESQSPSPLAGALPWLGEEGSPDSLALASLLNVRYVVAPPRRRGAGRGRGIPQRPNAALRVEPSQRPAPTDSEPATDAGVAWLTPPGPRGEGSSSRLAQELYFDRSPERLVLEVRGEPAEGGSVRVQLIADPPTGVLYAHYLDAGEPNLTLRLEPALHLDHKPLQLVIDRYRGAGRLGLALSASPHSAAGTLRLDGLAAPRPLALFSDERPLRPLWSDTDLTILENRGAVPRYRMVGRVAATDARGVLGRLHSIDMRREVLLDDADRKSLETNFLAKRPPRSRWKLRLFEDGPVRIRLETDLEAPGVLVISRSLPSRFWRAWVNGKPADLLSPYGMLAGLALPAGQHRVEMRFALPGPLPLAAFLAGLAALVVLLARLRWIDRS